MRQGRIPQEKIDEILEMVDIVEIVGAHVVLKKAGGSYTGLCPFHDEKTPSFHVSPQKRIFKCFGCGVGGNAIRFKMKLENKGFPQVVRELADRTGVVLDGLDRTEIGLLYKLHEVAARFFERKLAHSEEAQQYLKSRGLSERMIKAYNLGYAPDSWDGLLNEVKKEIGFVEPEVLEKSGLVSSNERGKIYDRFRDRVIFPIHDLHQRVIAFGGRVLTDAKPKYLNSPDTPLFDKGAVLYNLERAKVSKEVLVVEGYMDVLSLNSNGYPNAVAPLGTGFTHNHVSLLEKYFEKVVLLFDGDEAGSRATLRALERFIDSSMVVRALRLPDGLDPQDYLEQFGASSLRELVDNAPVAIRFFCDDVLRRYPLDERRTKKQAYVTLRDFFQNLNQVLLVGDDGMNEPELIHYLSTAFAVEESIIRKEFFLNHQGNRAALPGVGVLKSSNEMDALEAKLLEVMVLAARSKDYRSEFFQCFSRHHIQGICAKELLGFLEDSEETNLDQWLHDAGEELQEALSSLSWGDKIEQDKSLDDYKVEMKELKIKILQSVLLKITKDLSNPALEAEQRNHLEVERMRVISERNELLSS